MPSVLNPPQLSRSYSDKYLPSQSEFDLFANKNIDWVSSPSLPLFYVALVAFVWCILHVSQAFSWEDSWTAVNMIHGVITFVLFHWIKGCPDDSTQGEYNAFTLYEQIDVGVAWTSTKKFLMLVPTILTWIACYAADYKPIYLIVNVAIFAICIIAKMPQMHRVRIMGINSTPGIDDPVMIDSAPNTPADHKKSN